MEAFEGVIIQESLVNTELLQHCKILSTRISLVTEEHQTPWLKQWTLHTVLVPAEKADEFASELSYSLQSSPVNWYADFKSEHHHYVVYPNRIFIIDRSDAEQYRRATEYGVSIGIPAHQVDFEPHMKKVI